MLMCMSGVGSRVLLVAAVVGVGSRLFLVAIEGGWSTRLIFLPSGYLTSRYWKLLEVGVGRVMDVVVVVWIEGDTGVRDDIVSLARSEDGIGILEGADIREVLGVGLDDSVTHGVG